MGPAAQSVESRDHYTSSNLYTSTMSQLSVSVEGVTTSRIHCVAQLIHSSQHSSKAVAFSYYYCCANRHTDRWQQQQQQQQQLLWTTLSKYRVKTTLLHTLALLLLLLLLLLLCHCLAAELLLNVAA
jgi:hypothetical protein